jgi:hypothetical protein
MNQEPRRWSHDFVAARNKGGRWWGVTTHDCAWVDRPEDANVRPVGYDWTVAQIVGHDEPGACLVKLTRHFTQTWDDKAARWTTTVETEVHKDGVISEIIPQKES